MGNPGGKCGDHDTLVVRPYQLLCIVCSLGEDAEEPGDPRLRDILRSIRNHPDSPVALRCNAGDVFCYQDPGTEDDTPEGADFNTGSQTVGWKCLRFAVDHPISYQFNYSLNTGDWSSTFGGTYFVARAQGDLDGDSTSARFLRGGRVENGAVTMHTALWTEYETE